jgi:hypothetical protein
MKLRSVALLALLFLMAGLSAQGSSPDWYASSGLSGRYDGVKAELEALISSAERAGIPREILLARMVEGGEKRVDPAKLVLALTRDLDNYSKVLSVIATLPAGQARDRTSLIEGGGIALRSGMAFGTFQRVLLTAAGKGVAPRRAIDALIAVAAVDSRLALDDESEGRLALSLACSTEKAERFSSLSSLFVRGKAGKIGNKDLVSLAVSILDGGGGFLELEREIIRRIK